MPYNDFIQSHWRDSLLHYPYFPFLMPRSGTYIPDFFLKGICNPSTTQMFYFNLGSLLPWMVSLAIFYPTWHPASSILFTLQKSHYYLGYLLNSLCLMIYHWKHYTPWYLPEKGSNLSISTCIRNQFFYAEPEDMSVHEEYIILPPFDVLTKLIYHCAIYLSNTPWVTIWNCHHFILYL